MSNLPAAEPVEHYIWCVECDEPHEFYDGKLVIDNAEDACPAVEREYVDQLPVDWDRTHHAAYGDSEPGRRYFMVPKDVDPIPEVHRPMYFLLDAP